MSASDKSCKMQKVRAISAALQRLRENPKPTAEHALQIQRFERERERLLATMPTELVVDNDK